MRRTTPRSNEPTVWALVRQPANETCWVLDVTRRGNPSLTRLKAPVPQPVVSGI
jgi:hypothetical protein